MSGERKLTPKKAFTVLALSPFMALGFIAYIVWVACEVGWDAGTAVMGWWTKEEPHEP